MSDQKSGDDQVQRILWESEEGLSVPKDDARAAAAAARSRRDNSVSGRLRNTLQMDGAAAKWFLPAAVVVLVLLIATVAMYVSQASRVNALEGELAALREATATSGVEPLRSQVDALLSRVDRVESRLESRLGSADAAGEEIQALRSAVTEQKSELAAMSERLEKLAASGGSSEASAASPTQASAAPAPSGGDWIVNLITVADPTEAERMQKRLQELGVESRFDEVERDGKTLHRLVVTGFESNEEARKFSNRIKEQLGLPDDPWIAKQ